MRRYRVLREPMRDDGIAAVHLCARSDAKKVPMAVMRDGLHRERRHEVAGTTRAVFPRREVARHPVECHIHAIQPVEERRIQSYPDEEHGVASHLPRFEATALALDHRLEEQRDNTS